SVLSTQYSVLSYLVNSVRISNMLRRFAPLALLVPACFSLAAQTPDDLEGAQEKAMKAAVARVAPSVVQVETSGGADLIGAGPRRRRRKSRLASGRSPWAAPGPARIRRRRSASAS